MCHVRILVVDPEARQLDTICRGLFVFGHEAVPAATAEEAARLLAAPSPRAFEVLLTDVGTPDPSGMALLQAVQALTPALPTVIMTGLTHGADIAALRGLGTAVIAKPFRPDELDAAVRAAAAGRDGAVP
jgi:DNA-binding response OmpR family regulator